MLQHNFNWKNASTDEKLDQLREDMQVIYGLANRLKNDVIEILHRIESIESKMHTVVSLESYHKTLDVRLTCVERSIRS